MTECRAIEGDFPFKGNIMINHWCLKHIIISVHIDAVLNDLQMLQDVIFLSSLSTYCV